MAGAGRVLLTALAAQPVSSSEPWPVTSVLAQVVALVIVGLRSPRRVLVERWALLALVARGLSNAETGLVRPGE